MAKKRTTETPRVMTHRQMSSHKKQQRRQRFIFFGGIGIIAAVVIIVLIGVIVGEVLPNAKTVLQIGETEYSYSYYVDSLKVHALFQSSSDTKVTDINTQLPEQIKQHQMIREEGEALGITVSDGEIKEQIKEYGLDNNKATQDLVRTQLLVPKLKEYFGTTIPDTMPQVNLEAIFVESEAVAQQIRPQFVAAENITDIAMEYGLNYYSKNEFFGAFGWHPASILDDYMETSIPVDWAFSSDAGDISPPLADNTSSKKRGYWLIRVNDRSETTNSDNETAVSANVSAVLLSSEVQARFIRERLLSGEDLAAVAKEYSQYSISEQQGGELGLYEQPSDNTTNALSVATDPYIFGEDTGIGTWSEPILDEAYWTKGGAWLAKTVGRDDNRPLSEDDNSFLIAEKFNEWLTTMNQSDVYQVVNLIDNTQTLRAIAEVEKALAGG